MVGTAMGDGDMCATGAVCMLWGPHAPAGARSVYHQHSLSRMGEPGGVACAVVLKLDSPASQLVQTPRRQPPQEKP